MKRREWLTEKRAECLRVMLAGNEPSKVIMIRLAALPGPALPTWDTISTHAKMLGILRRASWVTKERLDYLQTSYAANEPYDVIMDHLASLPGSRLPRWTTVRAYVIRNLDTLRPPKEVKQKLSEEDEIRDASARFSEAITIKLGKHRNGKNPAHSGILSTTQGNAT